MQLEIAKLVYDDLSVDNFNQYLDQQLPLRNLRPTNYNQTAD